MNTTTPSKTPVADYFRDPKHHTKHAWGHSIDGDPLILRDIDEAACMCLSAKVRHLNIPRLTAFSKISDAIQTLFPDRYLSIPYSSPEDVVVYFNDHPDTTPADVLAVCEEAGV